MITGGQAGRLADIAKFRVTADGRDITAAVIASHVWQDIFTPSWSCSIVMSDTANIIQMIPLRQGTKLTITLETRMPGPTDGEKTFKFTLFKITDRVLVKSRHQTYVIHGISESFLKNQGKRVSKYLKGKPENLVSQMIQKELGGSVQTGSSDDTIETIIPNWSPFVAAQWMCKVATSNKAADFVFFMTDEGRYRMESVEKLYGEDCGLKLIQRIGDIRESNGNILSENTLAITQYHIEHFDGLVNLVGGYYASQKVTYDFVKKTWETKDFKFGEDISADRSKKSFTGEVFEDSKLANIGFMPTHKDMFKKDDDNVYNSSDKWVGTRKSSMMKLDQDRLYVQLPGGVKFWEHLGKGIEVDLESHEDMSGERYDKYFKGTYLIVAINHTVQGDAYYVNLELVKKRMARRME